MSHIPELMLADVLYWPGEVDQLPFTVLGAQNEDETPLTERRLDDREGKGGREFFLFLNFSP